VQYEVEINGRIRRVTIQRDGRMFIVDMDGTVRAVRAESIDAHTLSLLVAAGADGSGDAAAGADRRSSYEVTIAPDGESGKLGVRVGSATIGVLVNGRRRWRRREAGTHAGDAPQRIVAPMPGKIVRVLVGEGATVRARQPVVVIEAMKMENELRAGRDGVVTELHVREGQSVDAGGLLAVIAGHAG
jgi:biotin carboxyl carrier protein